MPVSKEDVLHELKAVDTYNGVNMFVNKFHDIRYFIAEITATGDISLVLRSEGNAITLTKTATKMTCLFGDSFKSSPFFSLYINQESGAPCVPRITQAGINFFDVSFVDSEGAIINMASLPGKIRLHCYAIYKGI